MSIHFSQTTANSFKNPYKNLLVFFLPAPPPLLHPQISKASQANQEDTMAAERRKEAC